LIDVDVLSIKARDPFYTNAYIRARSSEKLGRNKAETATGPVLQSRPAAGRENWRQK
jgi:hypothetical protein